MHNGGEVCESPYGHGVWCIERCSPNLKLNVLQKNIDHYCKAKFISMKKTTSMFMFHVMMVGGLISFGGGPCKFHKFYFCCDDLNHCVGGLGRKYVVDRPMCLQYGLSKKAHISLKMR